MVGVSDLMLMAHPRVVLELFLQVLWGLVNLKAHGVKISTQILHAHGVVCGPLAQKKNLPLEI